MSPLICAIAFFSFVLFSTVSSQTTHTVKVGASGSFFDPPTVSAQINDTVTFVFAADFHDVTQCQFESPCVPLRGGFSSGLVNRGDFATPAPSWDLRITNVSQPIWFFCAAVQPSSHCASGMVGVINPPSIEMYNQFVASAKFVTGTPAPSPSLILSGQGAVATNSPAPPSSTVVPLPTSTSSSETPAVTSTSATPTPTVAASTSSSSSSRNDAIIGGAVGGSIGGLLLLFLLIYWYRRRRNTADTKSFFRYRAPTPTMAFIKSAPNPSASTSVILPTSTPRGGGGGGASAGASIITPLRHQVSQEKVASSYTSSSLTQSHPYSSAADNKHLSIDDEPSYGAGLGYSDYPTTRSIPKKTSNQQFVAPPPPPPLARSASVQRGEKQDRQSATPEDIQLPMQDLGSPHVDGGSNVNINTLAREVAAVLLQNQDDEPPRVEGTDSPAPPPHYRSD